MSEILTESFCERCGTRYTFESGVPGRSVLGGVRLRAKGLRTFATGRRNTFGEAMADARAQEQTAATGQQLDAFHDAFTFCLGCRQYTCRECWNEPAGRCRTCVPLPGQEPRAQLIAGGRIAPSTGAPRVAGAIDSVAPEPVISEPVPWPNERRSRASEGAVPWPVEPGLVAPEVVAREVTAPVPAEPEAMAPQPEMHEAPAPAVVAPKAVPAEPVVWPARRPARASTGKRRAVTGLPPGRSGEEAVASYEARQAAEEARLEADVAARAAAAVERASTVEAEAPPEPDEVAAPAVIPEPIFEQVVAMAPPEPLAAAQPEPLVAAPAAEPVVAPRPPELVLAAATPPAVAAVPPEPVAQKPESDVWRTVAPDDDETPRWPTVRPWSGARTDHRPAHVRAGSSERVTPAADVAAMWAASAQQVMSAGPSGAPSTATIDGRVATTTPGVAHLCDRCGLALSATARFCRRCGLPQS